MTSVLVLAGTAEARALCERLAGTPGLDVAASLAGVTRDPPPLAVPVRTGGFGGIDGLVRWLETHGTRAIIDATHPFAAQMQAHAAAAAARTSTPRLRLLRPPWPDRPGWVHVPSLGDAARALPPGAHALLTTGSKEIAPFLARTDVRFTLRSIEPVADLPGHIAPLIARPPFETAAETRLMHDHGITHLVTKNAGGAGTAKLDAADALRLTTVVVARPTPPDGPVAATAPEAVAWLHALVANGA